MQKPQDLSEAISYCRVQCDRLGLGYKDPIIMLWIWAQGKQDWVDLDFEDFRNLYAFLQRCERKPRQLELTH